MTLFRRTPVLSLILCSRNDEYMGRSRWRLETALNYVGERVAAMGRVEDVEVLVADWGSDVPLREVVALGPAAAKIVSFVTIPQGLARPLQRDSPFPEVLALNAAARRARGRYIGRIDQDTLVGERFLRWFFDAVEGARRVGDPEVALERALLFANRRSIPYRFAVTCPRLRVVERFLAWFGRRLRIETGRVFYRIDVGIWLLHRNLWWECGGYDERMIYMNDMEIDMATRLMSTYAMIDLGKLVEYDFYHLDHYHPRGSRSSATHRAVNAQSLEPPLRLRPSGDGWGLAAYPLEVASQTRAQPKIISGIFRRTVLDGSIFVVAVLYTWMRMGLDRVVYPAYPKWRRRFDIALAAVRGESVTRWPGVLWRLWGERR